MTKKIFFLLILISNSTILFGHGLDNAFYDENLNIELITHPNLINKVTYNEKLILDNFDYIKTDPENLVSPEFKISKTILAPIKFWFDIYTKFNQNVTVLHDKENFKLIYNTINFNEFVKKSLGVITITNIRKQIEKERTIEIRMAIKKIFNKKKLNTFDKIILNRLKYADIILPSNKKKRKLLRKKLLSNLRRQPGLKNQVDQGLKYFNLYYSTILDYLDIFHLPEEILAIAFVESSFNPNAHSKASAVGVWQFIKKTGRSFLNLSPIDERKNILLSTLAAFHLLKQNYKIHKSWPFAITSYNSGHKHIFKAKKKYSKNITFENFVNKYSHPSVRFASKNYYSEFIAMVYALKYRKYFYAEAKKISPTKLFLYQYTCSFTLKKLSTLLNVPINYLRKLNPQLDKKKKYTPFTTFTYDKKINTRNFHQITADKFEKYYPKNFKKIFRRYNCSTK